MARGGSFRTMLAAGLLSQAGAAGAAVLILSSAGPSARRYSAGQRMPDAGRFVLRPGDRVTILFQGRTRTFRGPGSFSALERSQPLLGAVAGGVAARRSATGAVRPGIETTAPDYRFVNALRSHVACIATGVPITLWRPAQAGTMTVRIFGAGSARTLPWPDGAQTFVLPASADPPTRVEVETAGQTTAVAVSLVHFVDNATDREAAADALLRAGCQVQIEAFGAQFEGG